MYNWSPKQQRVFDAIFDKDNGIERPIIISGPTQSGKSISSVYGYLSWIASSFSGYDFLFTARSEAQWKEVLLKYCTEFGEATGLGFTRQAKHYVSESAMGSLPNSFHLRIGADRSSIEKAMGSTYAGIMIDEATLQPEEFVNTIFTRASVPGAKVIMTMNPSNPQHWLKRKYIDSGVGDYIQFGQKDNPSLLPSYYETLRKTLTTTQASRLIDGNWKAATGAVYPNVENSLIYEMPKDIISKKYYIGGDYAGSSVTFLVLIMLVKLSDGSTQHIAIEEWQWNHKERYQLSAKQQVQFAKRDLTRSRDISSIFIDPSAPAFISEFKKAGFTTFKANNKLLPGVYRVQQMMDNGELKLLMPNMSKTFESLAQYVWDEKASLLGDDKPLKDGKEHASDALRYYCMATNRRKPKAQHITTPERRIRGV